MGPLLKRICVNTTTLLTQSGENPLIPRKSLKMRLFLLRLSVPIEDPFNKTENRVYFKIRHSERDKDSGGESSTNSVLTCHKFGKKGYIQIYYKSNGNVSDRDSSESSTRNLPKWVTKKTIFSDV